MRKSLDQSPSLAHDLFLGNAVHTTVSSEPSDFTSSVSSQFDDASGTPDSIVAPLLNNRASQERLEEVTQLDEEGRELEFGFERMGPTPMETIQEEPGPAWRSPCGILSLLGTLLFLLGVVFRSFPIHHGVPVPSHRRAKNLRMCTSYLSGGDGPFEEKNAAQAMSLKWFFHGAGKGINKIPTPLRECRDDNSFSKLYGLVVLHQSLGLLPWKDAPVGSKTQDSVSYLANICHSWHRIQCGDNSLQQGGIKITKLHLSDMQDKAHADMGTMPDEIKWLEYLTQVELYRNSFVGGTIPDTLSRVTGLQILHLHETSIEATVPSSLGKLKLLQELFVDRTNLHGTMP